MARFGKTFEQCPKCGKKGYYIPRLWFGRKLAEDEIPRMYKYCHHCEIKKMGT